MIEIGNACNPKVLIVDDENEVLNSLADLLRKDFHVICHFRRRSGASPACFRQHVFPGDIRPKNADAYRCGAFGKSGNIQSGYGPYSFDGVF